MINIDNMIRQLSSVTKKTNEKLEDSNFKQIFDQKTSISLGSSIINISFDHQLKYVISSHQNYIEIIDYQSGLTLKNIQITDISYIDFSKLLKIFYIAQKNKILIWNSNNFKHIKQIKFNYKISIIQVSNSGSLMLLGSQDSNRFVQIYDFQQKKIIGELFLLQSKALYATFSNDDCIVAITSFSQGRNHGDKFITLYDVKTFKQIDQKYGPMHFLQHGQTISFSSDSKLMAVAGRNICIFKIENKKFELFKTIQQPSIQNITSVCFFNQVLISGDEFGDLKSWNLDSLEFKHIKSLGKDITSIKIQDKYIIVASGNHVIKIEQISC